MIWLSIGLIILALLASVISGAGKAFYDLSNHGKIHTSIFDDETKYNPEWWDYRLSWMNKNKGHKAFRTYLVMFTDAWHLAQFFMFKGFGFAMMCFIGAHALIRTDSIGYDVILGVGGVLILLITQNATFHICYRSLFIKPEYKKTIL